MNLAKNNILQHENGNSFVKVLRNKNIANVDWYMGDKLTHHKDNPTCKQFCQLQLKQVMR